MIIDATEEATIELAVGQILSKVHRYRLQRPEDKIYIEMHKIIFGADSKFQAVPVSALGVATTRKDLHVSGDIELNLLKVLIEKIKDLPKGEIFPKEK